MSDKLEVAKQRKILQIRAWLIQNALAVVILVMVVYTAIVTDNFASLGNLRNVLQNVSVRFVIALGVSGCLIIRGTDLSAGRIVGISAVLTGLMMQRADAPNVIYSELAGSHILLALVAAVVVGLIFGIINGLIVSFLNVPAFIATLGAQIAIYGLNQILSKNQPIGAFQPGFIKFGTQGVKLGGLIVPYIFFVALLVGLIMLILYRHTRYGKYMYAIGGNEVAAEVSGVNTRRSKIKIFALAGLLYGLAGFLLTARTGSAAVSAGTGYELEAIAASTIGGVSVSGGVGTVGGILLGVMIFELLKVCLQFLGITPEMTYVFQGCVIVIAVAFDIQKSIRKK